MAIDTIYALGDDALSNAFKITIPSFPGSTNTEPFSFRVTEVAVPETALGTYEVHFGTQKFTKISGKNETPNSFTFSYRLDRFYNLYEQIEKWLNASLSQANGKMSSDTGTSLRRDIIIEGLDSYGNVSALGWKMIGSLPSRQTAPSFSQENGDPLIIEVEFQFIKKVFLGKGATVINDGSAGATIGEAI